MATTPPRSSVRPAKDEWGVYDPQQAGLAALFARLDSNKAPAPAAEVKAKADETAAATPPPLPRPALRDAK